MGLDRLVLAVLADAYHEEVVPTSAAATANPSAAVIGDTSGSGSGKGSGGSGSGGAGKSGAPVVDTRVVLKLRPDLAPYFFAVLPLSKKQPLIELSRTVCDAIRSGRFDAHSSNANAAAAALTRSVEYDETGSIGRCCCCPVLSCSCPVPGKAVLTQCLMLCVCRQTISSIR